MNDLTPKEISVLKSLVKSLSGSAWVQAPTSIFCNPQHPGGLWSMAGEGGSYVDCPSNRLRGRTTRLWHSENAKGKTIWHLEITNGSETFLIHAPHDRGFSRSMLAGIAMMDMEQAAGDVTVECRAWKASEGMMQFCSFQTADGTKIDAPKVETSQLGAIARTAQTIIAEVNGYQYPPANE